MPCRLAKESSIALFVILLILSGFACSTTRQASDTGKGAQLSKIMDPYAGIWDYVVTDTPEGDMAGELIIAKDKGGYLASMKGATGEVEINEFQIVENRLSGTFEFQGMGIEFTGTFEGSTFSGKVGVDYSDFAITGIRRNP